MTDESRKEREILMVMRKVLAQVIKDTTPQFKTMKHPLSPTTIEDLRQCLGLIAARERELEEAAGVARQKPYFSDEKPKAEVVPITSIGGLKKKKPDSEN